MSNDPRVHAPTVHLGPPACLTKDQVGCLKTALALVIVKSRWEKQRTKHPNKEAGAGSSLLLPNIEPPAMTVGTGPFVSAARGAVTMDDSDGTNEMRNGSKGLKNWVDHLNQMMPVALQSRSDPSSTTKYQSVVTHVARQLSAIVARACVKRDDDSHQEAGVLVVKNWIFSSLLEADDSLIDLWIDIGFESHTVKDDFVLSSMNTIPDLLLSCLALILQSFLVLTTRRNEACHHYLRIFTALHPLASAEAINDCWTRLGVDDPDVACDSSVLYLEQCHRRDAMVHSDWVEGTGTRESDAVDLSQVLGLRRYLSKLFINVVQSAAQSGASNVEFQG